MEINAKRRSDTRLGLAGIVLAIAATVGCGGDLVAFEGTVQLNGQTAPVGILLFTPVGGGMAANSMVDEQGRFRLRTDGATGVTPGKYTVSFRHELTPEFAKTINRLSPGELARGGYSQTHRSPKTTPIVVPAEGTDDFVIEIDGKQGWTESVSD